MRTLKRNVALLMAGLFMGQLCGCGQDKKQEKEYIITFLGDSITQGFFGDPGYVELISQQKGIRLVQNLGIACSTIGIPSGYDEVLNNGTNPFVNRYGEIWPESDIVVVFGGTNDYGNTTSNNVILGTNTDRTAETFYGALHTLIDGIREAYPDIVIVMCTPLQRDNTYTNWPIAQENEFGYTLNDYRLAILEVANEKGVYTLDLYNSIKEFDCNSEEFSKYFQDGIHPNAQGHRLLAGEIYVGLSSILELE